MEVIKTKSKVFYLDQLVVDLSPDLAASLRIGDDDTSKKLIVSLLNQAKKGRVVLPASLDENPIPRKIEEIVYSTKERHPSFVTINFNQYEHLGRPKSLNIKESVSYSFKN